MSFAPMFLKKVVLALMALLIFTVPMAGGRFSFDVNLGQFGLMSLVGMLSLTLAIAYLLFGSRGLGQAKIPMDLSVTLFGIFVALNFASVGWAPNAGIAINSSINYLQIFIFIWLLLFLRSEPRAFTIILHAFFLGSLFLVVNSLHEVLSGGLDAIGGQRTAGFGVQVNSFAFKVALGIPVAFYLWQRGFPSLRWFYLMYVPAAAFLVLLTGSRTGAATAFIGLLAGLWLILRVEDGGRIRFSHKRLAISAAISIVLAFSVLPATYDRFTTQAERIASISDPLDASATTSGFGGRLHLWDAAFSAFLDNPILGVGSGGSRDAMRNYLGYEGLVVSLPMQGRSVHSAYFTVLSETGIIGALLYIAVLITLFVRIRSFPRAEQVLLLTLIAMALVNGVGGVGVYGRDFNLALFMSVIFLVRQQQFAREKLTSDDANLSETFRPSRA